MILAVLATTASAEEARRIARALVDGAWAACVHIERIDSVYRWEGETREEAEHRLLVKTTADAYPEVERLIRAHHSYEEPAIIALPVTAGSASYLRWVEENSAGAP